MTLKIKMRSPAEVLAWTAIVSELSVIATAAYFQALVSPDLFMPAFHHIVAASALLGAGLGCFGSWQIMPCQNYHRQLRRINDIDMLTRVHTRARFFADAKEVDISRCSILMIDVDRFKSINDTYGHQYGDEVLTHTAQRLRSACRSGDILARYGGEEFIVCLPVTSTKTGQRCAERLRLAVAAIDAPVRDERIPVTISVGLASGAEGDGLDELISRADKALLLAKSSGRNRVVTDEEVSALDPNRVVRKIRRTSRF